MANSTKDDAVVTPLQERSTCRRASIVVRS